MEICRPRRRTARTVYLRWLRLGMDPATAGNLTALSVGLTPAGSSGWSPDQIERLLFLAWLRRTRRFEP